VTGIVNLLRVGTAAALVLGVLGAVLPGDAGTATATAAVGVVAGVPLVRVAWLAARWARKGDVRFAGLAVALLAVIGLGVGIAW
jgi:hypothetical protein